MSSGWEHGKAVFQTNRLTDKWFKLWLGPGKKSNETRCRLCQNSTMLKKMGWCLTLSFTREKTQGNKSRFLLPCIYYALSRQPVNTKTDAVSVKKPTTLDNLVVSVSAAKGEIR